MLCVCGVCAVCVRLHGTLAGSLAGWLAGWLNSPAVCRLCAGSAEAAEMIRAVSIRPRPERSGGTGASAPHGAMRVTTNQSNEPRLYDYRSCTTSSCTSRPAGARVRPLRKQQCSSSRRHRTHVHRERERGRLGERRGSSVQCAVEEGHEREHHRRHV
jgi:hypothetical protein